MIRLLTRPPVNMSRRETRPVFASNTAFDVLASQSDEEKEEVEEVEESQPEEIKSVKVADPYVAILI